jgi:hypothetical protein
MFTDGSALKLDKYELLLFGSPEPRCLHGLGSIPQLGQLERAWIVTFVDYDEDQPKDLCRDDISAINQYHDHIAKLEKHLSESTSRVTKIPIRLNLLQPFDDPLGSPNPFECPLVVDISCAPRGHLLALLNYLARCQTADSQRISVMYSLVSRQSISEDAYSYGMQDVAVVPGFYGQIRLKHDLLILVLGFEGNRAFSLYKRLAPNKTFLIIGETDDEDRLFYKERANLNNHGLIHIYGNELRQMSSRDPYRFAEQLSKLLQSEIEPLAKRFNIYFSCLGTKLQTLGAFLAVQSHPYIQVVDSLPTRRRIASEGARQTLFADFGTRGLIDFPA